MLRRFTFVACLTLFIAACAGRGGPSTDPDTQNLWLAQQAAASSFGTWDMYARGILKRKAEAYNVNIRWQRQADGRFTMMLEAPFGQGVLRIETSAADRYRLRLPDGQVYENNSPEALLEDVIGWSLPLSGLDFWVRGLPHGRSEHRYQLDSLGRARSINQDGWRIEYLDYFAADGQVSLPRRFRLGNDDLSLKLVIERWQPAEVDAVDSELFPSFN